jgi:CDP-diacylglycerol--glycerol-3-phosphate 3-phosphatidyltransferase
MRPLEILPNALSLSRITLVPVAGACAYAGHPQLFLAALAAALASDVLDGQLARRTRVTSELGAKLDSWGDLATYATLPLFAYWLWPDLLRQEARYLACALVAYVLPIAVGLVRFGRLTSYHTIAAKLTAVVMGASLFVLFLGGPAWPFHAATFLLVVEAMEEIAISFVLPRWRSDVRSLWHAVRAADRSPRRVADRSPRRVADHSPRRPTSSASSAGSTFAFTVRRSSPSRRAVSS